MPVFVAADLLAQAEHDTHRAGHPGHDVRQSWRKPSTQKRLSQATALSRLEHRQTNPWSTVRAIVVPDLDTAIAVSNEYAPEHLIIQTREPRTLLPQRRMRRFGVHR